MEYRTIEGVEIVSVGMEWRASTGPFTCTFEDIADAVTAANDDPLILTPRIKIGHESEINGELRVVNPFAALDDAEPAFGRAVNLRTANAGAKLIADFIEVPAWLADAAPSAYPSRSIEADRRVTTEGNKTYTAVITAVSLLGPVIPAVKDLADLERLLIEGPGEAVAASNTPKEGSMTQIDASVATGTIRERFNWDWATSEPVDGIDTYYWWARDVRVDPNEIIADDTEGNTYSVPFETDGKDEVTFGEPVKVREEFVPVNASATSVVAAHRDRKGQRVLASNLDRPEKPDKPAASAQPEHEEKDEMKIDLDKLRSNLGLPEDATEEQINEALGKAPEAEVVTPTDEIPEAPEGGPETPAAQEAEPVAASAAAERGVTLDKDAVAQLKAEAADGRQAREVQLSAERDKLLSDAVQAGKFPPSAKASYRKQLDQGGEVEASTRKFIEELPDNTVPVKEVGEAGREDGVAASAGLPESWFPELKTGAAGAKED
jgi:Mu-like prophage I protein